MALDIDNNKLITLKCLLEEYSLQIEEIIGMRVVLKITGLTDSSVRDMVDEDFILNTVAQKVCDLYDITFKELTSEDRYRPLPDARAICYTTVKERLPKITLKKIGGFFGNRDHSTVLGGIATLKDKTETEPDLLMNLNIVRDLLNIKQQ